MIDDLSMSLIDEWESRVACARYSNTVFDSSPSFAPQILAILSAISLAELDSLQEWNGVVHTSFRLTSHVIARTNKYHPPRYGFSLAGFKNRSNEILNLTRTKRRSDGCLEM